jgi:membrane protein
MTTGWSRARRRLRRLFARLDAHRIGHAAAGCAFYATLAMVPAASMLISLFGLLADPHEVEPMLELLGPFLPDDAFSLLHRVVEGLTARPRAQLGTELAVGAVVALWSASAGTQAVLVGIDLAYEVRERGFLRFRLFSAGFTTVVIVAAILAIGVQVALPAIGALVGLGEQSALRLHIASLAVLLGLVVAILAWLYRFGPSHTPRRGRVIYPGVAVAGLLWLVGTSLFSIYAGRLAHFDATYGPLGAIATVMLWFWLCCYAVLVGAEVNALLEAEG